MTSIVHMEYLDLISYCNATCHFEFKFLPSYVVCSYLLKSGLFDSVSIMMRNIIGWFSSKLRFIVSFRRSQRPFNTSVPSSQLSSSSHQDTSTYEGHPGSKPLLQHFIWNDHICVCRPNDQSLWVSVSMHPPVLKSSPNLLSRAPFLAQRSDRSSGIRQY
jgi:hypothetical protein